MALYHIFKDANDEIFTLWDHDCFVSNYGEIFPNEIPKVNKYPVERIGTGSTSTPITLEELTMHLKEIMNE